MACRDRLGGCAFRRERFLLCGNSAGSAGDRGGYRVYGSARVGNGSFTKKTRPDLDSSFLYRYGYFDGRVAVKARRFCTDRYIFRYSHRRFSCRLYPGDRACGCHNSGDGRYGDGQSCLHTLGYPFPLLHHRQSFRESYHRSRLTGAWFCDGTSGIRASRTGRDFGASHAPLECIQCGAFAGTCRGGAGGRYYSARTHRCGALDCNCAADYGEYRDYDIARSGGTPSP